MTEPLTRPAPTPRDLDPERRRSTSARPTPAPYDRHAWEAAVMAASLHSNGRLVALVLAHHADEDGQIPAGGPQHAAQLAHDTGLQGRFARISLNTLEKEGLIWRPPIGDWEAREVRPVTLTMPPATTLTQPPHSGLAR